MGNLLSSLSKTIHVSLAIAVLLFLGLFYQNDGFSFDALFWSWFARFVHVVVGIMWIGLLWYFNFVQIPNMAKIPDEQKPAIGKVIAPAALFYFRWGAAFTVLSGLALAGLNGYLHDAMTLSIGSGIPKHTAIGIGMWLGLVMAFNVWFVIWPNQKRALFWLGHITNHTLNAITKPNHIPIPMAVCFGMPDPILKVIASCKYPLRPASAKPDRTVNAAPHLK